MSNNNSRISRRSIAKASLFLPGVVAVYLSGCGGGNKSSSPGTLSNTTTGSGRVQLRIAWPGRNPVAASRYLPAYAQSLVLTLNKKDDPAQTQTLTVNRPDDNPSTQTVDFPNELRVGIWVLTGLARASKDGGGTTVAAATTEIEVKLGQTADAPLTLASTIGGLTIVGEPLSLIEGQTLTLSGRAVDRDGFILFLPGGALTWSLVSGEASGSVTPDGIFTAIKQGTARVRLAEPEAGISAESDISITTQINSGLQLANSAWPKFRGNVQNTGRSTGVGSTVAVGTKKWEFFSNDRSGGIFGVQSSPAIGADGTVYIGSSGSTSLEAMPIPGGRVYAIDGSSGTKKWEFVITPLNNPYDTIINSSPAIDSDGTIYIASSVEGKVYALDGKSGAKQWEYTVVGNRIGSSPAVSSHAIGSSPAVSSNGTVYIGSSGLFDDSGGKVHALDGKTGTIKWEFITAGRVGTSSPTIGLDGTIYVGCFGSYSNNQGKLYALDGSNGTKKWEFATIGGDDITSSPAIGNDGTVYIAAADGKVYALDGYSGIKKWESNIAYVGSSSPALGLDGTIYIGGASLYALDGATGAQKWEFLIINTSYYSSPAVGLDGTIYIGSGDGAIGSGNGKLYAIDGSNGIKKWEFKTGDKIRSSPSIGADGTVYTSSIDGNLYAIG